MAEKDKIIAIIPARGGSKSIPRKNIMEFHGRPLVSWPIELAKSVKRIGRIVVSTDDEEIKSAAVKYGAEVPFLRPANLSADDTPTLPVLRHCLEYLRETEGYVPDIVLLLYPTSPLLKKNRIEEALGLLNNESCNSVVSVVKDHGHFWKEDAGKFSMFYPTERQNRQYVKPLYRENGAIYFNRYDVIMKMNKIIDEDRTAFLVMDADENVDIDEKTDFLKAAGIKSDIGQ